MAQLIDYGTIVAFSIIWSSAFVAGKIAVSSSGPVVILSFRFILSSIVLMPLWIMSIRNGFDINIFKRGVILGILNNTIYLGLSFAAVKLISPALVIVIISCSPFITVLIGAALGQEHLSLNKLAGMAVGFLGVVIIAAGQGAFPGSLMGVLLAFAGTVSFCTGTVLFGRKATSTSILQTNFYQSASAAVSLSFCAFAFGTPMALPQMHTALIIAYLAIVVTILGMALWLHLIKTVGPATASSIHLLNPAVGLLLSAAILGTSIAATDLIGSVVITAGLAIVLRSKR